MKRFLAYGLFLLGFCNLTLAEESALQINPESTPQEINAVTYLDVDRYMGKWFEVARLPTYFEKRCQAPILSEYTRDTDVIRLATTCMTVSGSVSTVYEGIVYLNEDNYHGSGKFSATSMPAWLRWTHLGRSKYWVLYTDYSFALVGTPDRQFLWIFSRNETPPLKIIQDLIQLAKDQGFDTSGLIFNYPSYYAL